MGDSLNSWALPQLQRLLPLDEQSLKEIITYSETLPKEAGAEHLKNLLGDSPHALEFISSFNSRRPDTVIVQSAQLSETAEPSQSQTASDNGPGPRNRGKRKPKAPLHNAGPVRRPENYGKMAGGYNKSQVEEDYVPRAARPASNALPDALSLAQGPAAPQAPASTHRPAALPAHSQKRSPASNPKLPPSASGSLISDLPNVRSKTSKKVAHNSGSSVPHKAATTSSINDLTSAIACLELSTNSSLSSERRKCQCNASIHPLFETAPNCLSCGKIICAFEGLQPCSFCDSPILSTDQVLTMIGALKEERGKERMAAHNAKESNLGRGMPMSGSGPATPETSGDEALKAAEKARAHRDRLLEFQRENAQRTRVHDEAADFDMTAAPGATQWMSPVQRAAALKKQQKYLRELQEAKKPDWEKKKTILSVSIRNGKLIRTFETVKGAAVQENEDPEETAGQNEGEESISGQSGGGLSQNPLLSGGGLVRPIWKASDDPERKGEERQNSGRRETWRRVQDDHEDVLL